MKPEFEKTSAAALCLTVKKDLIPAFFQLLGQGFLLKVQVGCSVRELLCHQIGLDDNYLSQRIQTIFLNGKAIDDMDAAVVSENSTLALSAAMPGLVGATLRRGGIYAAMRRQISHEPIPIHDRLKTGAVVLKLFNLVARELGPLFLKQGVRIRRDHLEGFFRNKPEGFWAGCLAAEIEGKPLNVNRLAGLKWGTPAVLLKLVVEI